MKDKEAWKNKLLTLDKRIRGFAEGYRQNVAILSDEGEEISYLLENYLKSNKLEENIYLHTATSYIDKNGFLKSVVLSLLSEYLQKAGSLDSLINDTAPILPVATTFIKSIFKTKSFSFADTLEIINKFMNESGKKCIFIIEEFLKLKVMFPAPFKDLSKFILSQRNCMIVLTSSSMKEAEKILANELNLIFGNFEKINLGDSTFLDNYLYVKSLLLPLSPPPLFITFFVTSVGTNLLYYDLISQAIKEYYCAGNEEKSIITILESAFYNKKSYFFQRFINKIELIKENFKDYHLTIKILIYLSKGYLRRKDLSALNICDYQNLHRQLLKLTSLNYIENMGDIYKIKDAFFSFWLAHVFTFYFMPPILDSWRRKCMWRKEICEEINIFKESFLKNKLNKVIDLLSCFKDDVLKIKTKKYKLPSINKIQIISYPERNFYITVGEGKEVLFAGIKEGLTEDSDILEFIERGMGIKGKRVKKIFISLEELSSTAKLIAKNHKLTIWDINEINSLLRIYNKPIISFNADERR